MFDSSSVRTVIAILLGGALVAVAIVVRNGGLPNPGQVVSGGVNNGAAVQREANNHIFGNSEAPITIIEFSDFECPFCSRLHPTLEQLVAEYPDTVKWEYRHLPLPNHPNAEAAAIATECIAELAGNEAFWAYTAQLFSGPRLTSTYLAEQAVTHGVSEADFNTCIARPDIRERIVSDVQAAFASGAQGTPFSVIQYPDGSTKPVSGALPFNQWVSLLAIE